MSKYDLSPLASADLDQLLDFIARDKPIAAVSFMQRIRRTCELLADNPQMGELRSDLVVVNARSFTVGNYIIFFRPMIDGVEVVRVVHGSRDIRHLGAD
ncbi:MAG TPA: type II toxin-antitoxin system RelE/ParE family toxin [Pirellulales bacterium]